MPDVWHVVFDAESGKCVSIGTDVADPLPPSLLAVAISDQQADDLMHCRATWDSVTRSVVAV